MSKMKNEFHRDWVRMLASVRAHLDGIERLLHRPDYASAMVDLKALRSLLFKHFKSLEAQAALIELPKRNRRT